MILTRAQLLIGSRIKEKDQQKLLYKYIIDFARDIDLLLRCAIRVKNCS
jgi:hypothetical protein